MGKKHLPSTDRIKGQEVAPKSLPLQPTAANGIKTQRSEAIFPVSQGNDPDRAAGLDEARAGFTDISLLQFRRKMRRRSLWMVQRW